MLYVWFPGDNEDGKILAHLSLAKSNSTSSQGGEIWNWSVNEKIPLQDSSGVSDLIRSSFKNFEANASRQISILLLLSISIVWPTGFHFKATFLRLCWENFKAKTKRKDQDKKNMKHMVTNRSDVLKKDAKSSQFSKFECIPQSKGLRQHQDLIAFNVFWFKVGPWIFWTIAWMSTFLRFKHEEQQQYSEH